MAKWKIVDPGVKAEQKPAASRWKIVSEGTKQPDASAVMSAQPSGMPLPQFSGPLKGRGQRGAMNAQRNADMTFQEATGADFTGFPRAVGAGLGGGAAFLAAGGPVNPLAPVAGVMGAAGGGLAGQAIEDLLTGKMMRGSATENLNRLGSAGTNEAMWEMGGGVVAKGVGKALAPFAGKMSDAAKTVARVVKEKNLPISPDAYANGSFRVNIPFEEEIARGVQKARGSSSGIARGVAELLPTNLGVDVSVKAASKPLQWMADLFPTGRVWGHFKRKQLAEGLVRMRDDVLSSLPARSEAVEAGYALDEAKKEAASGIFRKGRGLYTEARTVAGKAAEKMAASGSSSAIPMRNTREWVDNNIDAIDHDPALYKQMEKILKKTTGRGWTYKEVENLLANVWGRAKSGKTDPLRGQLKEAIKSDLMAWDKEAGEAIVSLRNQADETFKRGMEFVKNPYIKAISNAARNNPGEVIERAFTSGNMDAVQLLKKELPKEAWDVARSRFVENLLDKAMKNSEDGLGQVFQPQIFAGQIKKYGAQIKNSMPELYDTLNDFATVSQAAVGDFKKQNLKVGNMIGLGAAAAGVGVPVGSASLPALAVPAGFSFFAAKSLMNPKGIAREWLTTGAFPSIRTEAGQALLRQLPRGRALQKKEQTNGNGK